MGYSTVGSLNGEMSGLYSYAIEYRYAGFLGWNPQDDASKLSLIAFCAVHFTPQARFMALTGFYVVWRFFKLPPTAGYEQLASATRQFCGMPWAEVDEKLGENVNVEKYCLWGWYVLALLQQGLQIKEEQMAIGGWCVNA